MWASVVAAFLYGLNSSDPNPGIYIFQFLSVTEHSYNKCEKCEKAGNHVTHPDTDPTSNKYQ